jgi:hypothetical protein
VPWKNSREEGATGSPRFAATGAKHIIGSVHKSVSLETLARLALSDEAVAPKSHPIFTFPCMYGISARGTVTVPSRF